MPVHNKSVILLQSMNFIVNLVRYPISDNGAVRFVHECMLKWKAGQQTTWLISFAIYFCPRINMKSDSESRAVSMQSSQKQDIINWFWRAFDHSLCHIYLISEKKIYWCVDQVYDHVKERYILTFNEKLE